MSNQRLIAWATDLQTRGRTGDRRRRGSPLRLAATVAALTIAIAAPASAASGPTVSKVAPGRGPHSGGTTVTITGTNLSGATAVRFGSTSAESFTVNSSTSITAVSPAFTGTSAIVDVTVTTPEGTSPITKPSTPIGEGDEFDYEPIVTAIEPTGGPAAGDTTVTIHGSGFTAAFKRGEAPTCWICSVKFGSTRATKVKTESEGVITAVSPAGAGTVDVTAEALDGGTSPTSSADRFTYAATPPEFQINGVLAGAAKQNLVVIGALTLHTKLLGEFKCKILAGGQIWNEGGQGVAAFDAWEPFLCSAPECKGQSLVSVEQAVELIEGGTTEKPTYTPKRGSTSLPWPTEAIIPEAGTTRLNIRKMRLVLVCPEEGVEIPFTGNLEPRVVNGAGNGLFPTHLLFEGEGGKTSFLSSPFLLCDELPKDCELFASGELTMLGTSQQLITAE